MSPTLAVHGLQVSYRQRGRDLPALRDVSFAVEPGEAYGLVGESGCGKSTVAMAIMRYLPRNAHVTAGRIELAGESVWDMSERRLHAVRGAQIGFVGQDPAASLNPSMTIGTQVAEVYRHQRDMSWGEARSQAEEMLERVALPDPRRIMRRFPHEISGGQQQRVLIAIALVGNPKLLVLDEPTTGLDATVEAEMVALLSVLREEFRSAIVCISHNIGMVASTCERIGVLYAGRMVEEGSVDEVLRTSRHPYTRRLIQCIPEPGTTKRSHPLAPIPGSIPELGEELGGCVFAPRCSLAQPRCTEAEPDLSDLGGGHLSRCLFPERTPELQRPQAPASESPPAGSATTALVEVTGLTKRYRDVVACEDVSLTIGGGEVFGLVGESGSGKTTLVRCLAGLAVPDAGTIVYGGDALPSRLARRGATQLRAIQMVFQNPDSTLNPAHTARQILTRAISRLGGGQEPVELGRSVQLSAQHLARRPHRLSGGQRQRVAIGRALAGAPTLVLCDEPVSALDASVQAGILNLLSSLQDEQQLSYLFISHDLGVVRYIADRVGVMYLGRLIEVGDVEDLFSGPRHPYTDQLISAIPTLESRARSADRRPSARRAGIARPSSGCRFHAGCPLKIEGLCETEAPPWREAPGGHRLLCHLPLEQLADVQGAADPPR